MHIIDNIIMMNTVVLASIAGYLIQCTCIVIIIVATNLYEIINFREQGHALPAIKSDKT